jgi:predicted neuraminidase
MNRRIFKVILKTLFSLNILVGCSAHCEIKILQSECIFETPSFSACHASTIVELENGYLMAAWFGGSYEGCDDVCIYTATCKNGQWESPQKTAVGQIDALTRVACWNPVLFKADNKLLYLFYKVGPNPREWWGMVKTSTDDGKTWSNETRLPDGFLGPIRNKPVQLANRTIICPSSTESIDGKWRVHIELTNDSLTKWENVPVDTAGTFDAIQPTLLIHKNGALQMLCRSKQNCIVQSWSYNNGYSWDSLRCLEIPNPNSGIDAVSLSNGQFLLVYNPLFHGSNWFNGRNVLNVAISGDGLNWHDFVTLEDDPDGEYSYPAIIQTSDEKIHITYTANRKNIKHVVLLISN